MYRSIALLLVLVLFGCSSGESGSSSGRLQIATTFAPIDSLARRIVGDLADIECPLPEDADPATWHPDSDEVAKLQKVDLVLANGAQFEHWLDHAFLPESKVVRTADPFKDQWLKYKEKLTHKHGDEGEHTHEGVDGHTWLAPSLAKAQAQEILRVVSQKLPDQTKVLEQNYSKLAAELDALSARLKNLTPGITLYANHPAYNYLAREANLEIVNFDIDPDGELTTELKTRVATRLTEQPSQLMLWESEPNPNLKKAIESLGLRCLVFSPAEAATEANRDFIARLSEGIGSLESAIQALK